MSNFDPDHVFHLHMTAIFEQYKIGIGEAPEPAFARRESMLVGMLVSITQERWSAKEIRSRAQQALDLWINEMPPEMRECLALQEPE